jgi:hypothetical protein
VNNNYLTLLDHFKKFKGERVREWHPPNGLRGILEIPYTLWSSNDFFPQDSPHPLNIGTPPGLSKNPNNEKIFAKI